VPDVEKLRRVLAQVEEEAAKGSGSRWDQCHWAISRGGTAVEPTPDTCGTAFCFAGWAAVLDGAQLHWGKGYESGALVWVAEFQRRADGYMDDISEYAQRSLGLTSDEANVLFLGSNTLDDLRAIVQSLVDGEGVDQWLM
jgi:hypothetical protein